MVLRWAQQWEWTLFKRRVRASLDLFAVILSLVSGMALAVGILVGSNNTVTVGGVFTAALIACMAFVFAAGLFWIRAGTW